MASLFRHRYLVVNFTRGIIQCRKVNTFNTVNSHIRHIEASNKVRWQPIEHRCFHTSEPARRIIPFNLSDIGEGIREVIVKEWFVKEGDKVQQFDNICEVQSDKATVTITSRYDGTITKLYHQVDQTALVGNPLIDIDVEDEGSSEISKSAPAKIENKPNESKTAETQNEIGMQQKSKALTTPAVRRLASQYQVDLSKVTATGRNGRVMKEDVLAYLNMSSEETNIPTSRRAQEKIVSQASATAFVEIEADKTVPVNVFTKAMIKSMTAALAIPHFSFCDEYDVSKLVELRKNLKVIAEEKGVKFTYMPIILKAASMALHQYPILNSILDSKCENITYKSSHNIGVAMDTPNGLVVPVIRNVQSLSILQVANELNRLQALGSKGQLTLADMTGATFSLSNIGIVGGTYTKPVISPPQVAIGAFGRIQTLPRFDSTGAVVAAQVLHASWSADHRIIDGVTMAKFSNQLRRYLENPATMLLDL